MFLLRFEKEIIMWGYNFIKQLKDEYWKGRIRFEGDFSWWSEMIVNDI